MLDDVQCNPAKHRTLLQCPSPPLYKHNCVHREDAGVRCTGQKIVKNVSAVNITTHSTVLINVILENITNLFRVGCYNQQHGVYVSISVSNKTNTFTTHLRGLFPSSFYTCCTSAILCYQQYAARGTCTNIKIPSPIITTESPGLTTGSLFSTSNPVDLTISNQVESKAMTSESLVGGVLGFIITVLLVLLLIALVCLLQPKRR